MSDDTIEAEPIMPTKFKIPEIIMPTEAELQRASAEWLSIVGPTLIDRWPKDLLELSAKTTFIDLPQDCASLFDGADAFKAIATPIADEIDRKTGWDRHFFRLNSRSPKDALWPLEMAVTCSGKEIVQIMACSARVLDDLCYFSHSTAKPKLCLRELWPGVRPEREYRCFIVDGKILAVAEYLNLYGTSLDKPPAKYDHDLRAKIDTYLTETVIPRLPITTVVVDVVLLHELRLIEINPYGRSDPVGAQTYAAIENGIAGIARLPRRGRKT